MVKFKKTILLDLDGVLNIYNGNYDENFIPPIKDGAYEFIRELSKDYKVVIFTTRDSILASYWIKDNNLTQYVDHITNIKEPAYLIIDDRCINFNGSYDDLKNQIKNFKVWYKN